MPRVPLSALNPAPWNPRTISDERFKNLCRSIEADPGLLDLRPILARLDGTIYGGNMRYRAVQHLGWQDVPADLADIPERLAKERALRDNGSWGEWNDDLSALLAELKTADAALDLLGFDDDELTRLLAEPKVLNPDDADLTPPAEPVTKPGDLWLLGEHRLLCGDATNAEDAAQLMDGEQADVCLADPPYGIALDTDFSTIRGSLQLSGATHGTKGNTYAPIVGDGEPFDPRPLFAHFGNAAEIFLFGADYYSDLIPDRLAGSWLVWDKRKESQSEAVGSEFELIWSKQRHKRRMLRHDWFGFLSSANSAEAHDRQHPAQKPTSLLRDIIDQWSAESDLVSDPYAGVGSTLIAAEQLGRRCYAMEIEPAYCDVTVRRWEHVSGRQAVKENA